MEYGGGEEGIRKWTTLEAQLRSEIIGQREGLQLLAQALIRGEAGWIEPGRPRSFLLLLGETGVGKTESVLAAARHLWPGEDAVVRLDLAEYAERSAGLARLLGEGRGDAGLLSAALQARGKGGGILLLDELEKAHPDITRLFLGMEAARLTPRCGAPLCLERWHIICTSNLGSEIARELGTAVPYSTVRRAVEEEARRHLTSPVLARFGEIIVYRPLDFTLQREVCRLHLRRKLDFLGACWGRVLSADSAVVDFLLQQQPRLDLGARALRHVLDREIGNACARRLAVSRAAGFTECHLKVGLAGLEWGESPVGGG